MMMFGSYVDLEIEERGEGCFQIDLFRGNMCSVAVNGLKYAYFFNCKKTCIDSM